MKHTKIEDNNVNHPIIAMLYMLMHNDLKSGSKVKIDLQFDIIPEELVEQHNMSVNDGEDAVYGMQAEGEGNPLHIGLLIHSFLTKYPDVKSTVEILLEMTNREDGDNNEAADAAIQELMRSMGNDN